MFSSWHQRHTTAQSSHSTCSIDDAREHIRQKCMLHVGSREHRQSEALLPMQERKELQTTAAQLVLWPLETASSCKPTGQTACILVDHSGRSFRELILVIWVRGGGGMGGGGGGANLCSHSSAGYALAASTGQQPRKWFQPSPAACRRRSIEAAADRPPVAHHSPQVAATDYANGGSHKGR